MRYVFVDLEMNPIAKNYKQQRKICHNEVIEIGAVMLDEDGTEVGSYKQYVKPVYNKGIEKNIKNLTGIQDKDVAKAISFEEMWKDFFTWCGTECVVYTWSSNDARQIKRELILKEVEEAETYYGFLEAWKDLQKEFGELIKIKRNISLECAVGAIGAKFQGSQHDALCDARNTAEIFRVTKNEKRCKKAMHYIIELFEEKGNLTFSMGDLISKCMKN